MIIGQTAGKIFNLKDIRKFIHSKNVKNVCRQHALGLLFSYLN